MQLPAITRRWRPLFGVMPIVVIAPRVRTPGAIAALAYRARQKSKTDHVRDPKKVIPLELEQSMMTILAAEKDFEPPADNSERTIRKAIAVHVEKILKKGRWK